MSDPRLDSTHKDYAACRAVKHKLVRVASAIAPMRKSPDKQAMRISELLYGEAAEVIAEQGDFYLLQARHDNYVGYGLKSHFCDDKDFGTPTWQVSLNMAPLFAEADIKSAIVARISSGSPVACKITKGEDYAPIKINLHGKAQTAYIHHAHIKKPQPLPFTADSLIREARRYVGLPYVWGGRSFLGVDCSGLIQQVLMAHGKDCPRDSDMQAGLVEGVAAIGKAANSQKPQKGDICFWHSDKGGHVGIFAENSLIHAYGGCCAVSEDAAEDIFPRIKSGLKPSKNDVIEIIRCLF